MRRSIVTQSWVRGGLHPGAKHQKHVSLVPTEYLYRFPQNYQKPGPVVMKYYWTLGCFPTGLTTPLRLWEFLAEYQQGHIPEEVEEFLRRNVKDPVDTIDSLMRDLMESLNRLPNTVTNTVYTAQLPMVNSVLPHMQAIEKELGIEVPAVCLRAVAGDNYLKARALDDIFDYTTNLREGGSTPHRRAMRDLLEKSSKERGLGLEDLFLPNLSYYEQLPIGGGDKAAASKAPGSTEGDSIKAPIDTKVGEETANSEPLNYEPNPLACLKPSHNVIASALHVEKNYTAGDERALIRLLTTFGEGAMKAKKYDAAATALESALLFANDDDTRSIVHNNLATACNRAGEYRVAEHNAREAVLLNHNKKAFKNLGVALAYQHREDEALSVLDDAAKLYANDPEITTTQKQILDFASGRPVPKSLSAAKVGGAASRYYSNTSRSRAVANGVGNNFGNQFDEVSFNGKKITSRIDPTEFTQWFARAHVAGLAYRTSTAAFEQS